MVVKDLNYNPEGRNESKITLFDDNSKIENPTGASIEQTVERTEKKSHSFTLEIRKSESFEVGAHIDMSFTINANIFDKLGLKKETDEGIEGKFKETTEERNKETVKVEVEYRINQKVTVPAFTSVKVFANADKIDLVTPFNAKILINCKADRLSKNGKVIVMTDVDTSAVKYYLQKKSDKETFMDGNLYYMNTSGTLTVDGYGIITNIKTEPIDKSSMNSEFSQKNIVVLYQVILTFLQIIIFLQN
ncbi:hypothetical protein C1646_691352 [Rhizophagus diaphanus]|nr:hypothetical protein C1646_691352 [Rhizophagus diaphanus] [Rhizophagus sp. MUCL 43196]